MKLFITIISLLLGIIIGVSATTFFVVQRNQVVKDFLCADYEKPDEEKSAASLPGANSILNFFKDDKKDEPVAEDGNNSFGDDLKAQLEKFNEKNNISTDTDLEVTGPGGCSTEDECMAYCSNLENLKECLDFVKQNGFE